MFCIIFIISGYGYYSPYSVNYPNYQYNYAYPNYVAGAEAG